jgi:hypothetical protein
VNELLSMLVPLETLSGWPPAENPTALQTLVLLVGFPILVFLIVIAINKIVQTIHATRGDDPRISDPLYMVDARTGEAKLVDANPGTDAGQQALVGSGEVEGDDTGEHVGGAGARW